MKHPVSSCTPWNYVHHNHHEMSSLVDPLSDPVRINLIDTLRLAPPHWRHSICLFAICLGIDRFEASIDQIADPHTRWSGEELREIVDDVRHATDSGLPRIQRQHLVSRVLQRQWLTPQSELLSWYSIHRGLNPGGRGNISENLMYLRNFVSVDAKTTEDFWKETEDELPTIFESIELGTIFRNDQLVAKLRDLVIVHFARSFEVREVHNSTWQSGIRTYTESLQSNPRNLDRLFTLKRGHAPDPENALAARQEIINDFTGCSRQLFSSGLAFRFRILDLFEGSRLGWANSGIRILRPQANSEFLIGDAPVIQIDRDHTRRAMSLNQPDNIQQMFLPIGPNFAVLLDRNDSNNGYEDISSDAVKRYNTWEVEAAERAIVMRMGSYLEHFPETIRPAPPRTP